MKIYRGPISKPLQDPSHELVSNIDIDKSATFVDDTLILLVNITKDPTERQAVAHLQLNPIDLLALQQRMISGLTAKSDELKRTNAKMSSASKELYALYETPLPNTAGCEDAEIIPMLEAAIANLQETIGTLAYELDLTNHAPRIDA